MKRTFLFVVPIVLLFVAAVWLAPWLAHVAKPTPVMAQSNDVVIFFCTLASGPTTSVFETDSSPGAPTLTLGVTCSRALAFLMSQGFSIKEFSANPPVWAGEYIMVRSSN